MNPTVKQRDIVIGCILGDGYLYTNGRLQIEHGLRQIAYVQWKHKLLGNLVSGPISQCDRYDSRTSKTYSSQRFYTKAIFQEYRNIFYKNRRKSIPSNLEDLLVNPIALAVWFMDDGGRGGNSPKGIVINTSGFKADEQVILQACLVKNFGIETYLHKVGSGFQLYVPINYVDKFCRIVGEFIISSMLYKLPLTL